MLEYKIDVSKTIDIAKPILATSVLFVITYFFDINLRFDQTVCNGCHKLMQKAMIFNDAAIIFVKENNY